MGRSSTQSTQRALARAQSTCVAASRVTLQQACGGRALDARIITLAPELPGAIDAIGTLISNGVIVGIGRTAASLAQCYEAISAGARLVTHVMSSMPPFKHRDPGPVGLLADGQHHTGGDGGQPGSARKSKPQALVHTPMGTHRASPEIFFSMAVASLHSCTVNLAYGANPDGLILLSDLAERDESQSKRHKVEGEGGAERGGPPRDTDRKTFEIAEAVETADAAHATVGTIAQSALQLKHTTCSDDPAAALLCCSAHPARLLGLDVKGRLTPGADADLVLLDPADLTVRACYVAGRLAWSHPSLHGALWYHL